MLTAFILTVISKPALNMCIYVKAICLTSMWFYEIVSVLACAVLTCTKECAAGVVAALGLFRNLPGSTVEMQVSGDPAGLDSHQVTPDSWTRQKRWWFMSGAEHSVLGEVNKETWGDMGVISFSVRIVKGRIKNAVRSFKNFKKQYICQYCFCIEA